MAEHEEEVYQVAQRLAFIAVEAARDREVQSREAATREVAYQQIAARPQMIDRACMAEEFPEEGDEVRLVIPEPVKVASYIMNGNQMFGEKFLIISYFDSILILWNIGYSEHFQWLSRPSLCQTRLELIQLWFQTPQMTTKSTNSTFRLFDDHQTVVIWRIFRQHR